MNKRAISMLLALILCAGAIPAGAASTEASLVVPTTQYDFEYLQDVDTSWAGVGSEAIIAAAVESLIDEGKVKDILSPDDDLVEAILEETGKDFAVVKTYFADALISERSEGHIDASRYSLRQDTMERLLAYIREERNMGEDIFEYDFDTRKGFVTGINYEIAEAYSTVLDELKGVESPVEDFSLGTTIRDAMTDMFGGMFKPDEKVSEAVVVSEEAIAEAAIEEEMLYASSSSEASMDVVSLDEDVTEVAEEVDDETAEADDEETYPEVSITLNGENVKVGETITIEVALTNLTPDEIQVDISDNVKIVGVTPQNPAVYTVEGLAKGEATFAVTYADGFTTETTFEVIPADITEVTLDATEKTLVANTDDELTITASFNAGAEGAVAWTIDDESVVGIVNETDTTITVKALAAGTATVTATANGKTATCEITVPDVTVGGIALDVTSATMEKGETKVITATVLPENATNKSVTWTITGGNDVVKLTKQDNGAQVIVEAIGVGTATLMAVSVENGENAQCTIVVYEPVDSIAIQDEDGEEISEITLTLEKGADGNVISAESELLTAVIDPENATYDAIQWSSSDTKGEVISLDNGKITAVGRGSATVTLTVSGEYMEDMTTSVKVTVTVPVTGVALNEKTLSLDVGDVYTELDAEVYPKDATQNVTWSTDDEDVLSVEPHTGKITALKSGTANVIVTTEGIDKIGKHLSATCAVTVVVPVSEAAIEPSSVTIRQGETTDLSVVVGADVTGNYTVESWISNNTNVATVAGNGTTATVTAIDAGTTTIMATIKNENGTTTYAYCEVTVGIPVANLYLSETTLSLNIGDTPQLVATISPTDATNKEVTWSSSDTSVVTVDKDGYLKAVGAGTATITAITVDRDQYGNQLVEDCFVTVYPDTSGHNYQVVYEWAEGKTYKDLDGDGVTNSAQNPYADTGDYLLVYDEATDTYGAQPAMQTVYQLVSAKLTCQQHGEYCLGEGGGTLTTENGLEVGAYMVIDAITMATQILDQFGVEYDSNDNQSILDGLLGVVYSLGGQKIPDLAAMHVTVSFDPIVQDGQMVGIKADDMEDKIAKTLVDIGVGEIEYMTPDNVQQLAMNIGSTLFYAKYVDANGIEHIETRNGAEVDVITNYNSFRGYYYAKPEYFGFPNDYWTGKSTASEKVDGTPFGALKTMVGYGTSELVPTYYIDYMAQMLGQALIAYCYQTPYAEMLTMIRDNLIGVIEDLGPATDVQKLLVVHDYTANLASFDMNSIVQMKSDPNYANDPLGMLPFGAVVPAYTGQIQGLYGSLCLGYTAAFNYFVQWVLMGVEETSSGYRLKTNSNFDIDTIQIRYHSDVEESSVAGSDSGFTLEAGSDVSTIFNETHYMSAVSLDGGKYDKPWYYVDASYNDIHTETMTQYRVEMDGSVSHSFFLLSPASMADMYDGVFDYFDSSYDGLEYFKATSADLNQGYGTSLGYDLSYASIMSGELTVADDGYVYDKDGFVVYAYKEVAGENKQTTNTEYEEAWFSYATSSIAWDDEYFYYIHDNNANRVKTMRQYEEYEDSDMGDMDDMQDSFDTSGPEYANRLVRRARYTEDGYFTKDEKPLENNNNGGNDGGMTMNAEMYVPNDEYTETLFHYGFATSNPEKIDAGEAYAEENANDFSGMMGGEGDTSDGHEYDAFMTTDQYRLYLRERDNYFFENYPDLYHGLGLYDNFIYFSFADQIFKYDILKKTREESNLICATSDNEFGKDGYGDPVAPESLYDTVVGYSDGRQFIGMSYYTDPSVASAEVSAPHAELTVSDRPIAAFVIYDKPIFNLVPVYNEQGEATGVKLENYKTESGYDLGTPVIWQPVATVSIGTNYAQSHLKKIFMQDGKAVLDADGYVVEEEAKTMLPYEVEIPEGVYDRTWNRYNKEEDEKLKNYQFMWCANIVDYGFLQNEYKVAVEEVSLSEDSIVRTLVEEEFYEDSSKQTVIGDTFDLTATINSKYASAQSIVWSSDNDAVVTVGENVVVAGERNVMQNTVTVKGVGKANVTISVTDYYGNTVTDTCVFEIISTIPAETVKITLADSGEEVSEVIVVAEDATTDIALKAVLTPANSNSEVTWASADTTIATVSEDGVVVGVKPGETTVTATAGDVSASVVVKVYQKGDIDLNGAVDIQDANLLFNHSMLPNTFEIEYPGIIDFTEDGIIDIDDATLLFNHSMVPDHVPLP